MIKSLVGISLFASLLLLSISVGSADALKSDGTSTGKIGVDVCGDRLCDVGEDMTVEEKHGFYLLSLLEFDIPDNVEQQSYGSFTIQGNNLGMPLGTSLTSVGQFNAQYIPTVSIANNVNVEPAVNIPTTMAPLNQFNQNYGVTDRFASSQVSSSFASGNVFVQPLSIQKGFIPTADRIAVMIDKTNVLNGVIDVAQIQPGLKLTNANFVDTNNFIHIKISQEDEKKYVITPTLPDVILSTNLKQAYELVTPDLMILTGVIPGGSTSEPLPDEYLKFGFDCYSVYDSLQYIILRDPSLMYTFTYSDGTTEQRRHAADSIVFTSQNNPSFSYSVIPTHQSYSDQSSPGTINALNGGIDFIDDEHLYSAYLNFRDSGLTGNDVITATYTNSRTGESFTSSAQYFNPGSSNGFCIEDKEQIDRYPKSVLSLVPRSDSTVYLEFKNSKGEFCDVYLGSVAYYSNPNVYSHPDADETRFDYPCVRPHYDSDLHYETGGEQYISKPMFKVGDTVSVTPFDRLDDDIKYYYELTQETQIHSPLIIDDLATPGITENPDRLPSIELHPYQYHYQFGTGANSPVVEVRSYADNTDSTTYQIIPLEVSAIDRRSLYDDPENPVVKYSFEILLIETGTNTGHFTASLNQYVMASKFYGLTDDDSLKFSMYDSMGNYGTSGQLLHSLNAQVVP